MLTSETECRFELGVQVLDSDVSSCMKHMKHLFVCIIFSQCVRFNVFLSISAIGCVCCLGSLLFSYCPFHMVEGLDVAMRGAREGVGERCGR